MKHRHVRCAVCQLWQVGTDVLHYNAQWYSEKLACPVALACSRASFSPLTPILQVPHRRVKLATSVNWRALFACIRPLAIKRLHATWTSDKTSNASESSVSIQTACHQLCIQCACQLDMTECKLWWTWVCCDWSHSLSLMQASVCFGSCLPNGLLHHILCYRTWPPIAPLPIEHDLSLFSFKHNIPLSCWHPHYAVQGQLYSVVR